MLNADRVSLFSEGGRGAVIEQRRFVPLITLLLDVRGIAATESLPWCNHEARSILLPIRRVHDDLVTCLVLHK